MNFSTENINVGDKVICYSSGLGGERIGIVVKKTPSGLVDVSFGNYRERFKKNGYELQGNSWDHDWLGYCTDEKEKQIEEAKKIRDLARKISECKFREFTLEALELIWSICKIEIPVNEET